MSFWMFLIVYFLFGCLTLKLFRLFVHLGQLCLKLAENSFMIKCLMTTIFALPFIVFCRICY